MSNNSHGRRTAMKSLAVLPLYLLLLQGTPSVEASATFEWMLVSYNNPGGKDASGEVCDYIAGNCDHFFRFGLDWLGGSSRASDTPILTKMTHTFENENFNRFPSNEFTKGIHNPITHVFESWPGGILLKIHVEDDDSPMRGPEPVDDIVYRLVAPVAREKANSVPKKAEATGRRTTLTFTWRAYCNENFYGDECNKFCKPSDDSVNGHYTCDSFGNKVCLEGWDDADKNCFIKLDDCKNNRCQNDAYCMNEGRSHKCQCKPGFTGLLCETNIDECLLNPCQNGATCEDKTNDYFCRCPSEFVGRNCSIKACANSNPCLNGGTCYGESNCYCSPNFVGAKCQDPMCKVAGCLNGGICSIDGTCVCKPGYTGMRCEVDLCSSIGPFCQNGGFCREGKCQCPKNFTGAACEESLLCTSLTCERGACVVVMLKESQILAPECQCPAGYAGKRCETKEENVVGESLASTGQSGGSFSVFGILFVIVVTLLIISVVVIIVLSVLLCRKSKRAVERQQSEDRSTSASEIYSTVSETFTATMKNQKVPVTPNLYECQMGRSTPDFDYLKKSLEDVYIPDSSV